MNKLEYIHAKREMMRKRKHKKQIYFIRRCCVLLLFLIILLFVTSILLKACNSVKTTSNNDVESAVNTALDPTFYDPKIENDLLVITNTISVLHPEEKVCYLTFDDGPSPTITKKIIDVLNQKNVKATFFCLGKELKENGEIAQYIYGKGHMIANHSTTHNYSKLYASTESFISEIKSCNNQIEKFKKNDDNTINLVRFPGGCFESTKDRYSGIKMKCKDELAEIGYFEINWNALTGDADGSSKSPEQLFEYMKAHLSDKQSQVVLLMHDAEAKKNTPLALPAIIDYFRENGFEFRRLDEIPYYEDVEDYIINNKNDDSNNEG